MIMGNSQLVITNITIITVFTIVVIMINILITTIIKAEPDQRKPSLLRTSEMFQGCLQCQLDFHTNEDHCMVDFTFLEAHIEEVPWSAMEETNCQHPRAPRDVVAS